MSDAVTPSVVETTSASEIIGGTPPKKQRPKLPPGVKVQPVKPGASWGIHPVDGLGIRLSDAKLLETPGDEPPADPQPTPPPPVPPPAQPTEAPGPSQSQPEKEAAPDFSDLNGAPAGDGPQEQRQPTESELLTAYAQMGAMFWDSMIRLMCALFGDFWMPKTADERKMVIDALTGWMKSVAFAAFTPLQNLWMAVGLYAMPRFPQTVQKILAWWKGRKKKRAPETERKAPEGQPHNFSGVNVTDTESEVYRGPGT